MQIIKSSHDTIELRLFLPRILLIERLLERANSWAISPAMSMHRRLQTNRELGALDDHQLKDIGLTRDQANEVGLGNSAPLIKFHL